MEVKFLGHVVSSEGTKAIRDKVEELANFPKPGTIQQLRRFLGMVNFCRRFIPNVAHTSKALNNMVRGQNQRKLDFGKWTCILRNKSNYNKFTLTTTIF